jgi:tRNA(Ile)-lysidine synthase
MGPEDTALPRATPLPADPIDVARAARESCGLVPGERVLVAVSGGADSVALAGLLAQAGERGLRLELVLAHLDHGWRGPVEAAADRAVVETLAETLRLPVVFAGPPEPPVRGEAAARRWRYATLARLARESSATAVAVGHHLRDQAETVALRLTGGSREYGLRGMEPRRALDGGRLAVVRPLLALHPDTLRAWNVAHGFAWRDDPTNAAPGARNDVRRRIVALEARHRDPIDTLVRLAERAGARTEQRRARVQARLDEVRRVLLPRVAVSAELLGLAGLAGDELAQALRTLAAPLEPDRDGPWLTRRHVAACRAALDQRGAVDLPHGLTLRATSARAWLLRREPLPEPPALARRDAPRAEFDLDAFRLRAEPFVAALDSAVLGAAPHLRRAVRSDRFLPLGSAGRDVLLTEWLRRRGVPRLARNATWVLAGARGVAWIPGLREDARHAVTDATREVALLRVER